MREEVISRECSQDINIDICVSTDINSRNMEDVSKEFENLLDKALYKLFVTDYDIGDIGIEEQEDKFVLTCRAHFLQTGYSNHWYSPETGYDSYVDLPYSESSEGNVTRLLKFPGYETDELTLYWSDIDCF
ncbi:MAG: hypothetical protein J5525_13265 [Lachnospiraceae bacterium]|nr:hypothetical protein [Lachnospiraceae bacterium]